MGPDSGFAYEWVKLTGEKVWVVNAAHGGTSITTWQPSGDNYEECVALFSTCQETLRQEIAAGHYTLSHMAYFWCQGCTDYTKSAEWYVKKYLAMHSSFLTELAFDYNSDPDTPEKAFEFAGIIPVRAGHEWRTYYREGIYQDTTDKRYYESFKDLQFSGARVAQYLTAPEGAVALNVPMTDNRADYEVYILSAEHSYEAVVTAPTCIEQGYTTHTYACDERMHGAEKCVKYCVKIATNPKVVAALGKVNHRVCTPKL